MLAQSFHDFSRDAIGPVAAVALHAAVAGYVLAGILALAALLLPAKARMAWADGTGIAATLGLGVYFAARFAESGTTPLQNIFEVLVLSALFLALAYFVATRIKPMPALGGFAFPALALIFLLSFLLAGSAGRSDGPLDNPLLVLHIVLTVLAYGVFFMAATASLMFLISERALKRRVESRIVASFPPLETLKRLVNQCVWVGLPLLTLGFVLGFSAFSAADWAALHHNPKILASLVLWAVLLATFVGRVAGWLHGRRHYYLLLVGLVLVIASYVGLGLVERAARQGQDTVGRV